MLKSAEIALMTAIGGLVSLCATRLPGAIVPSVALPTESAQTLARQPLRSSSAPAAPPVQLNLSDYQWQNRLLLVFAPTRDTPNYRAQLQHWQAAEAEMRDRDLKLVSVVGQAGYLDERPLAPAAAAALRQQFGVGVAEFAVILVGKDGGEKQRADRPIAPADLFATIDAMPMRQQEMRRRAGS